MTKANRAALSRAKRLAAKRRKEGPKRAPTPADTDRPSAEELERAGQLRLIA